jgi:putative Mg2+ transporter-C (MgtC) family protein
MLYLQDLAKLLTACILGGLIGQQRQRKGMSIGLRTHIVVCVSAALVQITSIDYSLLNKSNVDVMRLGAQVISGIGFLGMASIIKEGRTIVGLTTAASMWFIACIGLAVGSNLYVPAIMATIIIYFILEDVFKIDKKISHNNLCELEVTLDGTQDSNNKIKNVISTLTNENIRVLNTDINVQDKTSIIIIMTLQLPIHIANNDLLQHLLQLEYIKKINIF